MVTVKVHMRTRPRVQPKSWYGVIVSDRSLKLSQELSTELCEIAELEEDSRRSKAMLFDVTEELSMFKSAQAALDHGPRPTHKRELLDAVLKRAKKHAPNDWVEEAEALTSWGGPLAWEFQREKWPSTADPEFFEKEWTKFAGAVLVKLRERESRHGPSQKAKYRLINALAFIFDQYAEQEHEEDRKTLRIEFVATALTAVGIQKADPEKLRHKSTSRLTRELPDPFTPAMARRRARLYKQILQQAEAKGQSLEFFVTNNPSLYADYREAGAKVKKS